MRQIGTRCNRRRSGHASPRLATALATQDRVVVSCPAADLEYLPDWTIWRDLKILFLTTRVLLHRNAF